MQYWPWWASGLALSGVMLFHWFALHRMMAVSGRISALIDRWRHGPEQQSPAMSQQDLLAAIQAATEDEFGPAESDTPSSAADMGQAPAPPNASGIDPAPAAGLASRPPRTPAEHACFFFGLIAGGAVAAVSSGMLEPTALLRGEIFARLTGEQTAVSASILAFGGVLVGFGTRMAGGCTSGHGLCGTSRLQPGSLLTTASFFCVGILVSFGLGALL